MNQACGADATKLAFDVFAVFADRAIADAESTSDVLASHPFSEKLQHLTLASAERGRGRGEIFATDQRRGSGRRRMR